MSARRRTLTLHWPAGSAEAAIAGEPRTDLLSEATLDGRTFQQAHGPFADYARTVDRAADGSVTETIDYRLSLPGFGWLLGRAVRRSLRHRRPDGASSHWWAPPDQLDAREARLLALMALASMAATFANTLFTQTVTFAADTFGVGDRGQGIAGAVVRLGVVFALPFAVVADRLGRRRTIVLTAWLAPTVCAVGAIAPNFWVLTASQTLGRPMGIALSLLAGVAAAEEMPRNSRAYALSVLALSAGLGAGVAVAALKLTDLGPQGWRLVYLLSLAWIPVAVVLMRHLGETRRFTTRHRIAPPLQRRRLALVAAVALTANLFVAPASYFQNRYLDDVRGYSGGGIALFVLLTGTPASLGLVVGGRIADVVGRRVLIAVCTPLSTAFLVGAFWANGPLMWACTLLGGFLAAVAYPAYAVYRSEMFPTGNRGRANGLVTTVALLAGSLGILAVGFARSHGVSFGAVMAVAGVGQLIAAWLAYRHYPETAHLELEQLNPEDPAVSDA